MVLSSRPSEWDPMGPVYWRPPAQVNLRSANHRIHQGILRLIERVVQRHPRVILGDHSHACAWLRGLRADVLVVNKEEGTLIVRIALPPLPLYDAEGPGRILSDQGFRSLKHHRHKAVNLLPIVELHYDSPGHRM
jgi:hypothetical protein